MGNGPLRTAGTPLPLEVIRALAEALRHRFSVPQTTGMCSGDVSMILENKKENRNSQLLFIYFLKFPTQVGVTASWAHSEPPLQIR